MVKVEQGKFKEPVYSNIIYTACMELPLFRVNKKVWGRWLGVLGVCDAAIH